MNKDLTIIIPSYKSRILVIHKLKFLSNKYKIIVIENSQDYKLKKIINESFKNTKIILKKNVGFGRAVNIAANIVRTKYFFVINPDTKLYKNTIVNLLNSAKKIKKYGGLSPEYFKKKFKKNNNKNIEVNKLYGAAMLFETKIFKSIKGFDKNFFLYFEENDLFYRLKKAKLKMYKIQNAYHYHTSIESSSAVMENKDEKYYSYLLTGWHGQWSKFYYYKKHKGYFKSLLICFPNLLTNIIKLIINIFFNLKKAKYYYFKIEGLLASILCMDSFKRSKYDK